MTTRTDFASKYNFALAPDSSDSDDEQDGVAICNSKIMASGKKLEKEDNELTSNSLVKDKTPDQQEGTGQ